MYRIIFRNLSTVERHRNYIPSKNKTWTYKKGYYKNNDINNYKKKKTFFSNNLQENIKNFYGNKYRYRL